MIVFYVNIEHMVKRKEKQIQILIQGGKYESEHFTKT